MKKKMKRKVQAVDVIVFVLLAIYALTLLALLFWGVLTSLKSYADFHEFTNVIGLPVLERPEESFTTLEWYMDYINKSTQALALGNYTTILFGDAFNVAASDQTYFSALFGKINKEPTVTYYGFSACLFNSILYSVICSFIHAFVAFGCAYLCAKYKFKFSEFIYVVMLVVMAVPIVGSTPAMITLLRDLGIYDTVFSMIVLNFNFTGVYFFVFYAHLSGVSNTYMEAAEIDGATQFGIFIRIIFPLCIKVFFTVFLLQFIQTWNDYQTPLLYYPNTPTLAYAVFRVTRATGQDATMETRGIPQISAGCMLLALPVFAMFIACNKTLMGNLTMGGLKE